MPMRTPAFFDKLVWVVLDGFRYDFVDRTSFMRQVVSEAAAGEDEFNALLFKAIAEPPTVTLPRLKTILTGRISSFLDVFANFDSQELPADQTHLLKQIKQANQSSRIVFYGDDTWLKLLPSGIFEQRSEGVTSFFVADVDEVDDNVTRHLSTEQTSMFDVLVLHYLGVDHAGHTRGPASALMDAQIAEMDSIVRRLYDEHVRSNAGVLLFVCSDHGMTSEGNHGGATDDERSTIALFIANRRARFKFNDFRHHAAAVRQADISATLSFLFGFLPPSPSSNSFFSKQYPQHAGEDGDDACIMNVPLMGVAIVLLLLCFARRLYAFPRTASITSSSVLTLSIVLMLVILVCSYASSSFVEEQHQTLYFLKTSFLFLLLLSANHRDNGHIDHINNNNNNSSSSSNISINAAILLLLVTARLARSWNTTGNKFLGAFDISDYLQQHPATEASLSLLSLLLLVSVNELPHLLAVFLPLSAGVFVYTNFYPSHHHFAQILLVLILLSCAAIGRKQRHVVFLLAASLLHRPCNHPLLFLFSLEAHLISRLLPSPLSASPVAMKVFVHVLGCASFFLLGNSNSIATIDMSRSYTFMTSSSNSLFLAGLNTFAITYTGPIFFWLFLLGGLNDDSNHNVVVKEMIILFQVASMLFIETVIVALRSHLFLYSVFAPKYLYEVVSTALALAFSVFL